MALREHLAAVEKQTGEHVAELHSDPPPTGIVYLWRWFCELHASRGSSGFGPLPIPYAEIEAWMRLTGRVVDTWEASILKRLDTAYLAHIAKKKPGA